MRPARLEDGQFSAFKASCSVMTTGFTCRHTAAIRSKGKQQYEGPRSPPLAYAAEQTQHAQAWEQVCSSSERGFRASINGFGRDSLCSLAIEQSWEAAHQKVHQKDGRVQTKPQDSLGTSSNLKDGPEHTFTETPRRTSCHRVP